MARTWISAVLFILTHLLYWVSLLEMTLLNYKNEDLDDYDEILASCEIIIND